MSFSRAMGGVCALLAMSGIVPPARAASSLQFALSSSDTALANGMPERYTANAFGCSGGNQSPPLQWRDAPSGTQSFVVTLFDRDERSTPSGWWHWVLYDLPKSVAGLPGGAGAAHSPLLPAQALQGRTDLGTAEYHGPCPARGDSPHRYLFTVYALDVATLPVAAEASGAMVTSTLSEHVLAKAILIVRYGR